MINLTFEKAIKVLSDPIKKVQFENDYRRNVPLGELINRYDLNVAGYYYIIGHLNLPERNLMGTTGHNGGDKSFVGKSLHMAIPRLVMNKLSIKIGETYKWVIIGTPESKIVQLQKAD